MLVRVGSPLRSITTAVSGGGSRPGELTDIHDGRTTKEFFVGNLVVCEQHPGECSVCLVWLLRTLQKIEECRHHRTIVGRGVMRVGHRRDGKDLGAILPHGVDDVSLHSLGALHKLGNIEIRGKPEGPNHVPDPQRVPSSR